MPKSIVCLLYIVSITHIDFQLWKAIYKRLQLNFLRFSFQLLIEYSLDFLILALINIEGCFRLKKV